MYAASGRLCYGEVRIKYDSMHPLLMFNVFVVECGLLIAQFNDSVSFMSEDNYFVVMCLCLGRRDAAIKNLEFQPSPDSLHQYEVLQMGYVSVF